MVWMNKVKGEHDEGGSRVVYVFDISFGVSAIQKRNF